VPGEDVTPLQKPGGFDRLALFVDMDSDRAPRDIHWDSNVLLLPGPSPTLVVGPDGRIVKAINVSVNGGVRDIGTLVDPDNDGTFSVDTIINRDDRGQALFRANDTDDANLSTSCRTGRCSRSARPSRGWISPISPIATW
jgi:hypothetical protein